MNVIHAPNSIVGAVRPTLFLAGSIEMGKASDWQAAFAGAFEGIPITFLNPRRPQWDPTWVQSIENPVFAEQVNWELDSIEAADIAVFYFEPSTMSPITLAELGLTLASGKCLVCCPQGFWRRGNVEIMCSRFKAPFFETLPELIEAARQRVLAIGGGR